MENEKESRWDLSANEAPDYWLNLAAFVRERYPMPVMDDGAAATQDGLASIFSSECGKIELLHGTYGTDKEISIPGEVLDLYRRYRATPLQRARHFERALGYEGTILFKREDGNPSGSHKPNTAIPQAWYAKQDGLKGLITDTGAGQWGAALAAACQDFGLSCTVFMTRDSYTSKPYRRYLMELTGAQVYASPSDITSAGCELLKTDASHQGSLGIGMGEAMELVRSQDEVRLALGCMSYYAALHQSIVGLEVVRQLQAARIDPDYLVACVGGGTNLAGFMAPYLSAAAEGKQGPRMVAAESRNIPVLTTGEYRYDYADAFGYTPKVKMYTLGHDFVPSKLHAGGLRYHGKSPILSLFVHEGLVDAVAIEQVKAFEAGRAFFEAEGILPAPESCHAIAAVIDIVKACQEAGESKNIVFCLSGTGYLDLLGYARMFSLEGSDVGAEERKK